MVPLIAAYMQTHDALFLEELPTIDFGRMLAGLMTVEEYVVTTDTEYPQFTRILCTALRELKSKERNRHSPCEDLERVYLAIIEALRGQKLNR